MNQRVVYSAKIATAWLFFILASAASIYSFLRGVREGLIFIPFSAFTAWLIAKKAKGNSNGRGIDPSQKVGIVTTLCVLFLALVMIFLLCFLVYLWTTA